MGTSREQIGDASRWQPAGEPPCGGYPINGLPRFRRHDEAAHRLALLTRTIERDVLPRLALASRASPVSLPVPVAGSTPLVPAEVLRYADLLLGRDDSASFTFVETLRAQARSPEAVYLDVLAPAARHLGTLWDQDLCDFTQVTIGLMRLQQILRRLSPAFQNEMARRNLDCRALLVPGPGEQHTFGLVMVAEFFRRAGWDVWGGPQSSRQDPVEIVRGIAFTVIGFSVGSNHTLDRLATLIRKVRRASRNPSIGIMVGGPIFLQDPSLAALIGADTTAADGREAVHRAHGLLDLQTAQS